MRTQKQLQLQLTTGTVYSEMRTDAYTEGVSTNTYKCVQMRIKAYTEAVTTSMYSLYQGFRSVKLCMEDHDLLYRKIIFKLKFNEI